METMDFGLIAGRKGIECIAKGLEGQPIRFYYTVPALCGLTPEEEINAPPNEELLSLLKDPRCLGVGRSFGETCSWMENRESGSGSSPR
jgi:adenine deaminase